MPSVGNTVASFFKVQQIVMIINFLDMFNKHQHATMLQKKEATVFEETLGDLLINAAISVLLSWVWVERDPSWDFRNRNCEVVLHNSREVRNRTPACEFNFQRNYEGRH